MNSPKSNEIFEGGAGVMVLLVDKDVNSLMNMSSILEAHSYRVTPTNSVFTALSMILERQSKFDLIISEIDMPGMDGFELLKQITSKVDIPTILISTNDDIEVTRKALAEGACFFFHKPIAPRNLVDVWLHCYAFRVRRDKLEKDKSSVLGEMPFSSNSLDMRNHIGEGVKENEHKPSSDSGYENQNKEKKKERTPPLTWTTELKKNFQEVYELLGDYRATPSKIKELMIEPRITVKQIGSYLQRFRARMKAQKKDATRPEMSTQPNNLMSGLIWGPGNLVQHSSNHNIPTGENSVRMGNLSLFRTNTSNNQFGPRFQRNIGLGWQPLAPNMANFQGNIGVGNFVPGLRPQRLPALNGGLGMVGDNFRGDEPNADYRNGSLGMRGGSIDMAQLMDAEEIEQLLYQFPDDDIGKDASSPGRSVNQP